MSRASERLREFHEAFDVKGWPESPTGTQVREVLSRRRSLHIEEDVELAEALSRGALSYDPAEVARELADVMVLAYGTADLLGIDLDAAFDAVMDANMAKLPPCEKCGAKGWLGGRWDGHNAVCGVCHGTGKGKPIKREDGKVLKPEGWREPDMSGAIRPTYDPVENFRAEVRRLLVSGEAITDARFNEIQNGPGVSAIHFENVWGADDRTIRLTRVEFCYPPMDVRA